MYVEQDHFALTVSLTTCPAWLNTRSHGTELGIFAS